MVSPSDLALATEPGADFDPSLRSFSEDELKPQPIAKKSRKQVSSNSKQFILITRGAQEKN